MLRMPERMDDVLEFMNRMKDATGIDLRVAAPGIIQSVDYARQTCTVQLAIREAMNNDGELEWADIPTLPDVPFFIYSGGGYCLTLPVSPGDECLVVFGDSCIDAWWQSGGVQNQIDRRRHDLSDGFAIVGFRSQPHVVGGYSSGSAQLRNADGSACIEISGSSINIQGSSVTINGQTTVNGQTAINGRTTIQGGTSIDGKDFLSHTHSGVETGGGKTGGVS